MVFFAVAAAAVAWLSQSHQRYAAEQESIKKLFEVTPVDNKYVFYNDGINGAVM